ncbi:MAG: Cellulosome-anchoring protein precursor [Pelotomaculum sp. PtaB.Bin104]|nr:MAG: Cellulosome-anchoring protein precursor [Pelotomaculum sp. PtaB.Bin104]
MSIKRKPKDCRSSCYQLNVFFLILVIISWFCCTMALASAAQGVPVFGDINGHWAQIYISRLSTLELVKGYPDHTFKPDQLVDRLETVVLIVRSGGFTAEAEQLANKSNKKNDKRLTDGLKTKQTPKVPWGQSYVDLAVGKGFLELDDPGSYDCSGSATRLEVAGLLARAMFLVPPSTQSESTPTEKNTLSETSSAKIFSDLDTLKPVEQAFVTAVANADVMSGYPDGTFRPQESLTRAEMAVILSRLVDRGWIKISSNSRLAGWISGVEDNKGHQEILLTSMSGVKKLQVASNVQCYQAGEIKSLKQAVNFRCEVILDGQRQVNWVNLLEQKDETVKTEKIRGSVKTIVLGEDSLIAISNMYVEDLILPLAWDAVLTGKKATKGFNSLKQGDFIDAEVAKGQVRKVTLLDVKTTSGKVDRIEMGRLYLKGNSTGKKPIWFNHYDNARIINKEGVQQGIVQADDQVSITYLDPIPDEIDDELVIEIKIMK